MAGTPDHRFFAAWFDKLVKNKMGAGALPVSGISIGYTVIQGSRIVPLFDEDVALLGLRLMIASVICFISFMVIFIILWTRERARDGRKSRQSVGAGPGKAVASRTKAT